MIPPLSFRQIFIVIAFGLAVIFELICAILVLKRDPHYHGNRLTFLAYLSLSMTLSLSASYVIITDMTIVEILHRFAKVFTIITVVLLFLTAMYFSEGPESLRSYRMVIIAIDLLVGLFIFIAPGISVFLSTNGSNGSEVLIRWDFLFFLEATMPLYFTVLLTCYYYQKVWTDIPSDSPIKNACFSIMVGTALLGLSHFLLVIPLFLRTLMPNINALSFTAIGSIGVLVASLFIFLGYRTKISEKSSVLD